MQSSEDDIQKRKAGRRPENTLKNDRWGVKVWKEWAQYRNKSTAANARQRFPIPVDLTSKTDMDLVSQWIPYFIMEVRGKQSEYTPDSLKQLICGIYRHVREVCGYKGESWLNPSTEIKKVLDTRCKELMKEGKGLQVKRSDIMTINEEKLLWSTKVLNMESAQGLLNAIFVYNGKVLALRGREEHRYLSIQQFKFKERDGLRFVEFWPHLIRKNKQGVSGYKKIRQEAIHQYDNDNNARSYYKILKRYLEAVGETSGPFYRRPLINSPTLKFSRQPIGVNLIGKMLQKIYSEAGINDTSKQVSNHGLRATAVTRLHQAGIKQKFIADRTGHRSEAIEKYIRNDPETIKQMSMCLDPLVSQPLGVENSNVQHVRENAMTNQPSSPTLSVPKFEVKCGFVDKRFCISLAFDEPVKEMCSLEFSSDGKGLSVFLDTPNK